MKRIHVLFAISAAAAAAVVATPARAVPAGHAVSHDVDTSRTCRNLEDGEVEGDGMITGGSGTFEGATGGLHVHATLDESAYTIDFDSIQRTIVCDEP